LTQQKGVLLLLCEFSFRELFANGMEMDFSILGTVFVCVFLIERNNTATANEVVSIQ